MASLARQADALAAAAADGDYFYRHRVGNEATIDVHDFEMHVRAAHAGDVHGIADACVTHALVVDGRPTERTYGGPDLVADLVSLARCWSPPRRRAGHSGGR